MGSTKDSPQVFHQPIDQADLAAARILVVDDNPQNLELMHAYLEGLGCQLQTAEDGVVCTCGACSGELRKIQPVVGAC